MKKIIIGIIVLVVIISGVWWWRQSSKISTTEEFPYQLKVTTTPIDDYSMTAKGALLDFANQVKQTIEVVGVEAFLGRVYKPEELVKVIKTGSNDYPFMLLIQNTEGATGNKSYLFRLYDSQTGFLVCDGARKDVSGPLRGIGSRNECYAGDIDWDNNRRMLASSHNIGCAGQCYMQNEYSIVNGKLTTVSEVEQKFPNSDMTYPMVRIYRKLVNGQMIEQSRKMINESEVWSETP